MAAELLPGNEQPQYIAENYGLIEEIWLSIRLDAVDMLDARSG